MISSTKLSNVSQIERHQQLNYLESCILRAAFRKKQELYLRFHGPLYPWTEKHLTNKGYSFSFAEKHLLHITW